MDAARMARMLDRATAKSDEQARAGNLPRVVRRGFGEVIWCVASRTEGGVYYLLRESDEGEITCDCPASVLCWHRVHVGRALAGVIGTLENAHRPPMTIGGDYWR